MPEGVHTHEPCTAGAVEPASCMQRTVTLAMACAEVVLAVLQDVVATLPSLTTAPFLVVILLLLVACAMQYVMTASLEEP